MTPLTVIVPIYNVSDFLTHCLTTIQNQTLSDFKCLMVDDGSTDNSTAIAQKFCSDPRFELIKTKHYSLAHAQNTALAHVQSEYVTFCDGDDYWDKNAYSKFQPFFKYHPDMIISDMYFEYPHNDIRKRNFKLPVFMDKQQLITNFPEIYCQQLMFYDTNKVYRTATVKDIKFQNTTVGLDTMYNYEVFARCQSIYFNPRPYYHHLQRCGSLVNHFDPYRLTIREKETQALEKLLNCWQPPYAQKLVNVDWFTNLLFSVKNTYMPTHEGKLIPQKQRLQRLKEILQKCLPHIKIQYLTSKEKKLITYLQELTDNDQLLVDTWSPTVKKMY